MDGRRARALAWSGPLFLVLFVVGLALQGDAPGSGASGQEVADFFGGRQGRTVVLALATPLLATLLVLFFAHLRSLARERRVSTGAGPTVMVCGAVLWAGGMLLGSTLQLALADAADAADAAGDGGTQTFETLNVLGNASWLPFIAGTAITLIGAGATVLGSDFLPRWLGWVALVAGVVSLAGPGGFLGFFVGPLWMLVAGVLLGRAKAPVRDPHRTERRADRPMTTV